MNTSKRHIPDFVIGGGKRLDYNDLCKAVGMLLIMWGHIKLSGWSNAFVYAFHIPLFFMLSGMVFSKQKYPSFKVFLKKKAKSLLLPYAVYSFVTWVIWAVFAVVTHSDVESYWMPLLETVIAQGSGGFLVHNVPLWFVTCLFVMELFYFLIADLRKQYIVIISFVMAAVSYCLINYCDCFDFTLLPWNIEVAMLGMPFFAVGNLAVSKWEHNGMIQYVKSRKELSWVLIVVFAVVVAIGSLYNGSISFGHAYLGKNVFVTYGCAFLGTIMLIMFCILLSQSKINIRLNALKWFGRNSFDVMAIHNPIKGIIVVALSFVFHVSTSAVSDSVLYSFIAFLLTLFVTVVCIVLINKFKKAVFSKK